MGTQTEYQSFLELFNESEIAIAKDSMGNMWVRATEACKQLEFSGNADRILKTYCKPHQYQQLKLGKGRPSWYVSESGFYRLILKSKSLVAENFIDWLTEEVLPKLRASGGYIMPTATSDQLEALAAEIDFLKEQKLLAEAKAMSLEEENHRIAEAAFDYFKTTQALATFGRDLLSYLGYLEFTKKKTATEIKSLAISAVQALKPHREMIEKIYLHTVSYEVVRDRNIKEYLESLFKHLAKI